MEKLPMPRLAQPQSKSRTKTSSPVKKSHLPYNIILKQPFVEMISPSYNQMPKLVVKIFGYQLLT